MTEKKERLASAGLLLLRVGLGGLMLGSHGLPKLLAFAEKSQTFSDPLGVGSVASLSLAIFAEAFCSLAVILGVGTRFVAVPLIVTMLVAALVIHADDPFGKKEFPMLYAIGFATLVLTGAGRFSIDHVLARRRKRA